MNLFELENPKPIEEVIFVIFIWFFLFPLFFVINKLINDRKSK